MTRITETSGPTKDTERMSVNRFEPSLEMSTTSGAYIVSLRYTCSMSEQRFHRALHLQLVRVQTCSH
jgi:hypothetical protein